jgi:hypothetical protein
VKGGHAAEVQAAILADGNPHVNHFSDYTDHFSHGPFPAAELNISSAFDTSPQPQGLQHRVVDVIAAESFQGFSAPVGLPALGVSSNASVKLALTRKRRHRPSTSTKESNLMPRFRKASRSFSVGSRTPAYPQNCEAEWCNFVPDNLRDYLRHLAAKHVRDKPDLIVAQLAAEICRRRCLISGCPSCVRSDTIKRHLTSSVHSLTALEDFIASNSTVCINLDQLSNPADKAKAIMDKLHELGQSRQQVKALRALALIWSKAGYDVASAAQSPFCKLAQAARHEGIAPFALEGTTLMEIGRDAEEATRNTQGPEPPSSPASVLSLPRSDTSLDMAAVDDSIMDFHMVDGNQIPDGE